ncbi:MAG: GNAT family N-acetyltransferase [Ktedonobacterales bacterium]
MQSMANTVLLRDVEASDLPIFFEQQLDPGANVMAAFTAKNPADRQAFMAHWAQILGNGSNLNQTIILDGQVVGNIASFITEESGHREREVSYWIGKQYWGRGIATQALSLLLELLQERPLYARVAKDNGASLRVLEKCGFRIIGEGSGFANARNAEVAEWLLQLEAGA